MTALEPLLRASLDAAADAPWLAYGTAAPATPAPSRSAQGRRRAAAQRAKPVAAESVHAEAALFLREGRDNVKFDCHPTSPRSLWGT